MPYEIYRSPLASHDIRQFVRYLRREAGIPIAHLYFNALEHDIEVVIAHNPNIFGWFHETGEPY